jgi:predicted nucleotidyltransferase
MRIFSENDYVEKKIPRKEDFKPTLVEFESVCIDPFLGNKVLGSFTYGSINRGDVSVASDIDELIIISDEDHRKVIQKAAQKAYDERHIEIQTRVIHVDHAVSGMHSVDDSFREHLGMSVQRYGFKGENPLKLLSKREIPFERSLRESMARYLMRMGNMVSQVMGSEEERIRSLKSILEKPFHAMRVAIQFEYGTVAPDGIEDLEDTKDELVRIYEDMDIDGEVRDKCIWDINQIRGTAGRYVDLLEVRVDEGDRWSKSESIGRYQQMLKEIEDCYSIAYHFIDQNARLMIGRNEQKNLKTPM